MVGNICSAVPSCDAGPVLMAYDAQVVLASAAGALYAAQTLLDRPVDKLQLEGVFQRVTPLLCIGLLQRRGAAGRAIGNSCARGCCRGGDVVRGGAAVRRLPCYR